jgi:hypothetical protein
MNLRDESVLYGLPDACIAREPLTQTALLQRANSLFAGRFMVSASVFLHFGGKPKVKPL